MVVWGLEFWGHGLGFWVWDFQSIEFGACGVWLLSFSMGWALCKYRRITLGKTLPYSH